MELNIQTPQTNAKRQWASAYKRMAEAAFGANTPAAHGWLTQAQTNLWEGCLQDVIQACCTFLHHPQAHASTEKAITYYTHNQKRMDSARFRQQGYLIGSGTIESECKQIASVRLKRSGARWTLAGVIATAKARAARLSKTWDQLKPFYRSSPSLPTTFECSRSSVLTFFVFGGARFAEGESGWLGLRDINPPGLPN